MELPYLIILVVSGACVGFASGLLGVGGAFILAPIQFEIYLRMGLPEDLAIMTAFGTSLLVVLPTAISGTWQHRNNKTVNWKAAFIIGITSMVFALIGASLANHIPAKVLRIAFGILLLVLVLRLLIHRVPDSKREPVIENWKWVLWAVPVGLASGLFGIGGGIILIPVLVLALRFRIHIAIGTSLAVVALTSLGGVAGYIINGIGVAGRLPYSIGYVLTFYRGYF